MGEQVDSSLKIGIFTLSLIVNTFILAPIIIYYLSHFLKLSKESHVMLIKKRYPEITNMSCYLCLIILLLERNVDAFVDANLTHIFGQNSLKVIGRIRIFLYILVGAIYYCGLARFWLIFYDLKMAKALKHSAWKKYINSEVVHNDWFLSNKLKYGSSVYIKKLLFFAWCITSIIRVCLLQIFIFHQNFASIVYILDGILYLIPLVFGSIFAWNAPSIEDKFYFKAEIRYYMLTLFVVFFVFVLTLILREFIDPYYTQIILHISGSFGAFGVCILQTAWIMNKVDSKGHTLKDRARSSSETLREFISTQDGFEQFMTYLKKEFSLELMLFVVMFHIETVQFKELLLTLSQNIHIPLNENADIESKYGDNTKVVLTANVPKSKMVHILFDNDDEKTTLEQRLSAFAEFDSDSFADSLKQTIVSEMEYMDKFKVTYVYIFSMFSYVKNRVVINVLHVVIILSAWLLYEKYIANGSLLQINISGNDKAILRELLSNPMRFMQAGMNEMELYRLFDDAIDEMFTLMKFSYGRFRAND